MENANALGSMSGELDIAKKINKKNEMGVKERNRGM